MKCNQAQGLQQVHIYSNKINVWRTSVDFYQWMSNEKSVRNENGAWIITINAESTTLIYCLYTEGEGRHRLSGSVKVNWIFMQLRWW